MGIFSRIFRSKAQPQGAPTKTAAPHTHQWVENDRGYKTCSIPGCDARREIVREQPPPTPPPVGYNGD